MSTVTELHAAVKQGNLGALKALLEEHRRLANARSEADSMGTYPLHVGGLAPVRRATAVFLICLTWGAAAAHGSIK